jgi:hypothetical protein
MRKSQLSSARKRGTRPQAGGPLVRTSSWATTSAA